MRAWTARESGAGAPDPDGGGTLTRGEKAVEEQRAAVRTMFDRVSRRYDLLNRLLSFGLDARWRREAIREASLRPGDRFLDVACGTGDLGIEAAGMKEVRTLGVDFSSEMLRRGIVKAEGRRVRLAAGAAEHLPVLDGAFGAAGIAFGIRNVPDRCAALAEMTRAVRPGGRVVVLEFTTSGSGAVERAVDFYLRRLLPRIGGLLSSRGAYRYLAESMNAFPPPEAFVREMKSAGLEDVRSRRLRPAPTWLYVGTRPR